MSSTISSKPPLPARPAASVGPTVATASTPLAFGAPRSGPQGAYYRKVVSQSSTATLGIHTTGVLPWPTFDSARQTPRGPKDIPDVYVGGTSSKGAEIDCGLAWNRVTDSAGRQLFTDKPNGTDGGPNGADLAHQFHVVSGTYYDGNGTKLASNDPRIAKLKPDFAYHPYFRTDYQGTNRAGNHDASDHRLAYYYPGQSFAMQLGVSQKGAAELSVNVPNQPAFAVHFTAPGFDDSARSFKRVISIDQEGNEGKPVAATRATLRQGGWSSVDLVKADGSSVPLTARNGTLIGGSDTLQNYSRVYNAYNANANGGEYVDIVPSRR